MKSVNKADSEKSNQFIELKDLMFLWKVFSKNLLIILFVPVLAYFIGYVYTYSMQYKFGAKVQLLLKSGETYDYQEQIYQGLGAYGMYMDVQNQMRILRSKDLIGEVVDKMNADISYYIVGRIQKREVYESLPFEAEVSVFNSALYEKPVQVIIHDKENYSIRYDLGNGELEHGGQFGKDLVTDDFILKLEKAFTFSHIDLITSSDYEIVFHSRDFLISKYQSSISIENLEYTSILEVQVVDELIPRAVTFLDTLTTVYVDFSKRQQLEVNQNTLDNIEKQLDTVEAFIEQKELELLMYKDSAAVLDPDKEEDQYFQEYFQNLAVQRNLRRSKESLLALKSYMQNTENEHLLPPSFYIEKEDAYLSSAVGKIRELQLDLEIMLSSLKEDNNNVKTKRNEIRMLKGDIITYIDNAVIAIDKELTRIDQFTSSRRFDIKNLPKTEQGIMNIQRELDVNNEMFLFLLEKKTNTLIARAGIVPQVQVVESTTSLGAVAPNKSRIKQLFLFGGIIAAILLALIRTAFFERINSVTELAEVSDLNVLGGIPFVKDQGDQLVVSDKPKSNVTEAFRSIRTNLLFLGENEGGKAKRIMVSSFFPQEGKTFTSTNLSALLSKGDKKVLLIDFDLHRPKIHKSLNLPNTNGVSNFIIGKANSSEIIQKGVLDNLDVISAGPISPNPSELIIRDKVNDLFNELESKYDYIITDTAPFGLLNDSMELAKKMDVFVVVFNTRYSRRRGIQRVEEMLSKFEEDVSIGVVLNNIRMRRLQYYYAKYTYKYTYSYGYSYGYGYGYGKEYGSDFEDD